MSLPSRVLVVVAVEELSFFFIIFHVLWKDQPALVIENFLPFFFSFSSLYPLSIPFLKLQLLRLHIDRFRFKFRTFL